MSDNNLNTELPDSPGEFSYDGYQVVRGEFFAHLFEPSITLNDEHVAVNAACIRKLSNVEYVQFLVNPEEKKLAVKPCSEDTKDSFCWRTKSSDGKLKPKSISCKIFYAKVMQLMGWNPNHRHKILGKLIRTTEESVFVFDLTSAETFIRQRGDGEVPSRSPIYPEDWHNQFGIPVREHSDTVLINIFDKYTVFRIERNEGEQTNESNNISRSEEKPDTDSQNDTSVTG